MDEVDIRYNGRKMRFSFYEHERKPKIPWKFILAVLGMALVMCLVFSQARSEEVNLNIIAKIESNNNPLAYNSRTGATGMYQFLPIAWKDVQNNFPELKKYPFSYARKPQVARLFAKRYFALIDRYLTHYNMPLTLQNRIACYNQGIRVTSKGIMSKETKNYINKYILLDK